MTRRPEMRASCTACKCCAHSATPSNADIGTAAAARSFAVSKVPRRLTNQMRRNLAALHTSLHSSARLAAQPVVQ